MDKILCVLLSLPLVFVAYMWRQNYLRKKPLEETEGITLEEVEGITKEQLEGLKAEELKAVGYALNDLKVRLEGVRAFQAKMDAKIIKLKEKVCDDCRKKLQG